MFPRHRTVEDLKKAGAPGVRRRVFPTVSAWLWRVSCTEVRMLRMIVASLAVACMAPAGVRADALGDFPDPTRPIGRAPSAPPVPREPVVEHRRDELEATFISAARKLALINGRYVAVGDKVGDAVVAEIRAYEVVLTSRHGQRVLRMVPRLTKPAEVGGAIPSRLSEVK